MMIKKLFLLVMGGVMLFSCDSSPRGETPPNGQETGEIVSNTRVDNPDLPPQTRAEMGTDSYVIQSDTENVHLLRVSFDEGKTYQDIDFSQYSVLSCYAWGGGCNVNFTRHVYKNVAQKQIEYKINVLESGTCLMMVTNMNWVLVPKIPLDYKIVFTVKNNEGEYTHTLYQ